MPSGGLNNVRVDGEMRDCLNNIIDEKCLLTLKELNQELTGLSQCMNSRGHSESPCGWPLMNFITSDISLLRFVLATILVLQLKHNPFTTLPTHSGNLWALIISISYFMIDRIISFLYIDPRHPQVSSRSSVISAHHAINQEIIDCTTTALAPLCSLSTNSYLSRCWFIGFNIHKVNHL